MWSDERFAKYKGILFDVDGTLTSGTLILGTEGEAYKIFHAQDGMALGLAHHMGYITGFITGRTSDIVRVRAEELKVDVLLMGVKIRYRPWQRPWKSIVCVGKKSLSWEMI